MCEAMEKLTAKAAAEGMAKGRAEGRAEGRINTFVELVKDGVLTLAEAAKRVGMSVPEFEARADLMAQ